MNWVERLMASIAHFSFDRIPRADIINRFANREINRDRARRRQRARRRVRTRMQKLSRRINWGLK